MSGSSTNSPVVAAARQISPSVKRQMECLALTRCAVAARELKSALDNRKDDTLARNNH